MAKYELWVNLYPGYGYNVYPSKEQADADAESNRIKCCKIEWEDPVRVADYLVPQIWLHIEKDGKAHTYYRQTHPIGQQPDWSVMIPGSEREAQVPDNG